MKFLILLIIPFLSCKKPDTEEGKIIPNVGIPIAKKYNYLALGDSYTIGQNVTQKESYPYQLSELLKTREINTDSIEVIAQTGWTTADLINAIKVKNLKQKFDFVTLLIGVNNQYRGAPSLKYREEFVQLITTAIEFANNDPKRVFVLSIPDWGYTPFAESYSVDMVKNSKEIDEFNAINKEESLKAGANYTDVTTISRMAIEDPSLIANDGLHPSAKMYKLWINKLEPEILTQFN